MYVSQTVETLFSIFDSSAVVLRKELDVTYLEALVETGDNLFEGAILQEELSEAAIERLNREYSTFNEETYKGEEIRKAFQLAILKGMKEGVQANHEMTPDAVGMFMSYLFHKFMQGQNEITVLDPAIGTGNLMTTVFNSAKEGLTMSGFGVEVDEVLIKLALVNANLQKHAIEFFHQDGLAPLYIDPVDAVISDLPIGYYPNEIGASEYKLKADEGMSYAHHLFIEQSVKHTKEGGYLFFLVPNFIFESDQAPKLHAFIKETCFIQGLLQLPVSMFKNEKNAKSIFVLQKKGPSVTMPKQALLVELPKFSNMKAMEDIMDQLNTWFATHK
ncbi:SAM-dependent methyltransferase [Bacillus thuringiensis serovar brasilensis]|jgi:site-specific DNA-methyltransferase (adenine-specific)|uniref:SAM-dependent methyltransferase n=1 Tax=Bacillus thuringiensis serovar mexicanensis TaxID=180868 RepID=A0A242W854_BACTU|nr:class I SAM-dependent methyltransferase [Bacillus sp. UTDS19-33BHI26]AUD22809.1 class I SAM-dependent methyltransferase [Bacillus sp. HBCD-sjtu]OPD56447.1 SAM-dependent methyltransferase [Bacillus anthracis]OTW47958.1 SAM-dependent methyltransferase [Bacillus thuringiensis serovar mexicanensis]OTW97949.1 SAM-dependent methyltransferase [Bacillus thuringiensis serovar monterrey]OTX26716.1 SAM-dependent methyltransferase [Bacillus thuringiensis serovar brasilensis]OTX49855.1 SAM-dependent me